MKSIIFILMMIPMLAMAGGVPKEPASTDSWTPYVAAGIAATNIDADVPSKSKYKAPDMDSNYEHEPMSSDWSVDNNDGWDQTGWIEIGTTNKFAGIALEYIGSVNSDFDMTRKFTDCYKRCYETEEMKQSQNGKIEIQHSITPWLYAHRTFGRVDIQAGAGANYSQVKTQYLGHSNSNWDWNPAARVGATVAMTDRLALIVLAEKVFNRDAEIDGNDIDLDTYTVKAGLRFSF